MPGIGNAANALLIIIGSALGMLLKKEVPERFKNIIFTATGIGVLLLGALGVVTAATTAANGGTISSRWGLLMVLSLVIGGVLGELIGIDKGFDRLGEWMRKTFFRSTDGGKSEGFTTASILFCSGAMAIIGSMEDAAGMPSVLLTKGIIDCVTALIFTTMYGKDVIFSAVSVFVYQGALTIMAFWLTPYIPGDMIAMISMVGSAVLMLIGFSLLGIKKFNVANMIPAMFVPALLYWIPFLR